MTTKITQEVLEDGAITEAKLASNSVNAEQLNVSGNGIAGQFLASDGDGTMTWTTPSATSAQSLTQNGYATLNGGLIIQWGYNNDNTNSVTITFPIPFPNACLNVMATPEKIGDTNGIGDTIGPSSKPTTTQVTISAVNDSSRGFYWQAIGY